MLKKDIINHGLKLWLDRNNIDLIITKVTGLTKNQLFLIKDIKDKYIENIKKNFLRLSEWEPIEYIINKAEFYNLEFYVDNRTLIPRNETEIIIEQTLKELEKNKDNKITLIDIWTWSWCIPISILKNIPIYIEQINNIFAIDISKKALEVTKKNINKYNLKNNIRTINWNLLNDFLNWEYKIKNWILIITANLPYIKQDDFKNMDKSVIKYEPHTALYGWNQTGFELYEILIEQTIKLKQDYKSSLKKILLFIEIGFDQYEISKEFLQNNKLKFEYFYDCNTIIRTLKITF